jgi:hypothetical protein
MVWLVYQEMLEEEISCSLSFPLAPRSSAAPEPAD